MGTKKETAQTSEMARDLLRAVVANSRDEDNEEAHNLVAVARQALQDMEERKVERYKRGVA